MALISSIYSWIFSRSLFDLFDTPIPSLILRSFICLWKSNNVNWLKTAKSNRALEIHQGEKSKNFARSSNLESQTCRKREKEKQNRTGSNNFKLSDTQEFTALECIFVCECVCRSFFFIVPSAASIIDYKNFHFGQPVRTVRARAPKATQQQQQQHNTIS